MILGERSIANYAYAYLSDSINEIEVYTRCMLIFVNVYIEFEPCAITW